MYDFQGVVVGSLHLSSCIVGEAQAPICQADGLFDRERVCIRFLKNIYSSVVEFSTYKSPKMSPPVPMNPSFVPLKNGTNTGKDLSISTVVALVVSVPADGLGLADGGYVASRSESHLRMSNTGWRTASHS